MASSSKKTGEKLYASISAAALAAAKNLGLKNKTQNGYIFWGLAKPAGDPAAAVERAWERYRKLAERLGKTLLARHAQAIEAAP